MIKDIIGGTVVILIVAILWSWASNIGPAVLLPGHDDQYIAFDEPDVLPVIECDTDSDCMAKNPHLGDY